MDTNITYGWKLIGGNFHIFHAVGRSVSRSIGRSVCFGLIQDGGKNRENAYWLIYKTIAGLVNFTMPWTFIK